jgi:hypothetical protein
MVGGLRSLLDSARRRLRRSAWESRGEYVAAPLIRLNDNGAWSWFSRDRAIVHDGQLIVGSVRAVGTFQRGQRDPDWGNVELVVHDIARARTRRTVLHRHFEQDDHDAPALLVLPDRRLLAVYTRHAVERRAYCRMSGPGDPLVWGEAIPIDTPGVDAPAFRGDNVTYSSVFRFPGGRIYDFFRGVGFDPNFMWSDDGGHSWAHGGRLLVGRDGYGPYVTYAFDGRVLHFIATEDHPRTFPNSIYHGLLRDGEICRSDGTPIAKLGQTGTATAVWDLTPVFRGDPDHVGWIIDIQLDAERRPYIAFSVQRDGRARWRRPGGRDHRYCFARWDGTRWHVHEMAHGGSRLYAGEDHYTGLVALHPTRPDVVYISTNADPVTGRPLVSRTDRRRHHEVFRGRTPDGGRSWTWTPITADSTADNLRPIVPRWDDPRTPLVWMRGRYTRNRGAWTTAVVAAMLPPE